MLMGHCHLFPGGRGAARRDEFGIPGTTEHLHGFVRACGFRQAHALAPHDNPESYNLEACIRDGRDGLEWLLAQPFVGVDENAELIPAATIQPQAADAVRKLARARAAGVRTLKVHPLIQRFDPLDAACEPFFRAAEIAHMPTVWHTGGGNWGWPTVHSSVAVCAQVAARCPGLPILMAHCGVFGEVDDFELAISACEAQPNLYLDITSATVRIGKARWRAALERISVERLIYGNDYPWATVSSVQQELEFFESLGLSADERAGILGDNLRALCRRVSAATSGG
jgi:predicted TIM-barrel fold metal-dependent hydrolase